MLKKTDSFSRFSEVGQYPISNNEGQLFEFCPERLSNFQADTFFLRLVIFLPKLVRIKISLQLCKHSTTNKHPAIFQPHSISG